MSQIVETSTGTVEVEVIGSGYPILVLHGSPGGIDAARAMSRFLTTDTFQCILVSRPGYLRTPLDSMNRSIDHEADLLAAVLDAVNVSRAGILAWSGGGPSAYRLAVRHPNQIFAVVAIAAVSFRWIAPRPDAAQRFLFGTGMGKHLVAFLSRYLPEQVVGGALEGEGSVRGEALRLLTKQTMADPEQRQLVLDIAQTVNTVGQRQEGWQNDVANYANIDSLELDQIKCPVLLVHGDADTDADMKHSRFAHEQIPDSEVVVMEQGSHLAFYAHPRAAETQNRAKTWLSRCAAASK
ncbi:MAG: hypothetical protein M1821_001787 [Bathelium mastoideum]|nr:MAG: hypothetical protein M1821_001787 [Bathelium mastoideum]